MKTPASRPAYVLDRAFYDRPADEVARDALGQILVVAGPAGETRCRIVETEAYVGEQDLACHASKGRTPRTGILFGPPGHAYVYLIYGMHALLNLVTAREGEAHAVLIRGLEPLSPVDGRTDGPGRLTKTLGITVALHNGLNLCAPPIWLEPGAPPQDVSTSARIGVDYAGEWAGAPLRFYDPSSPCVSR